MGKGWGVGSDGHTRWRRSVQKLQKLQKLGPWAVLVANGQWGSGYKYTNTGLSQRTKALGEPQNTLKSLRLGLRRDFCQALLEGLGPSYHESTTTAEVTVLCLLVVPGTGTQTSDTWLTSTSSASARPSLLRLISFAQDARKHTLASPLAAIIARIITSLATSSPRPQTSPPFSPRIAQRPKINSFLNRPSWPRQASQSASPSVSNSSTARLAMHLRGTHDLQSDARRDTIGVALGPRGYILHTPTHGIFMCLVKDVKAKVWLPSYSQLLGLAIQLARCEVPIATPSRTPLEDCERACNHCAIAKATGHLSDIYQPRMIFDALKQIRAQHQARSLLERLRLLYYCMFSKQPMPSIHPKLSSASSLAASAPVNRSSAVPGSFMAPKRPREATQTPSNKLDEPQNYPTNEALC
ncbi:hypothetical protein NLG97_g9238 [Lecanicillium saksenae]|uniref:Uncharacterized protein n=1 Tax=Lecanicillium saksenae TaxID=468837 RepID=A0ACC1QJX8_9HYPO|nr:hypothetical protein NLG97_g9238 [Lecanicillium saksenae]